jgi:hypothetical protein
MKNLTYCCPDFEVAVTRPSTTAPAIRIVRYKSNAYLQIAKPRLFYITIGYEQFEKDSAKMNISFCPFCGTNLKHFYTSDEYDNEIEGETF